MRVRKLRVLTIFCGICLYDFKSSDNADREVRGKKVLEGLLKDLDNYPLILGFCSAVLLATRLWQTSLKEDTRQRTGPSISSMQRDSPSPLQEHLEDCFYFLICVKNILVWPVWCTSLIIMPSGMKHHVYQATPCWLS